MIGSTINNTLKGIVISSIFAKIDANRQSFAKLSSITHVKYAVYLQFIFYYLKSAFICKYACICIWSFKNTKFKCMIFQLYI